jgi:hypothetical protein
VQEDWEFAEAIFLVLEVQAAVQLSTSTDRKPIILCSSILYEGLFFIIVPPSNNGQHEVAAVL